MNIITTPLRRKLRFILQKIFRIKTIAIVFILLLTLDAIFQKTLGETYEEEYPLIFWILLPFMFYVLFGFSLPVIRAIERGKKYYLIPSIFLGSIILFAIYWVADVKLPDWFLLHNILSYLTVSLWVAIILLLLMQIIKLRKTHAVLLFHKLRVHKIAIGINILLLILLLTSAYYGIDQVKKLNARLEAVENKLGGTKKITCSETVSVNKLRPSVVRVVGGEGEGSGFSIGKGLILTNFHVIEFEPSPKVIFLDNAFETAEIIMANKNADLAILKIEKDLPIISWGNALELEPAEELLMMGYPFGGDLSGEATLKKGYLSGSRYSKDAGISYVQTDATINPGMSGGPMINVCGEVVGINTLGTGGLGLAISSTSIKEKWLEMSSSKDSLKDIKKISFDDTESADFAVATYYNYLKVRKLDKAFEILSDNFKEGHGFDYWKQGYESLLDTTVIKIEDDKDKKDRVTIKLSTKDMVDDEIVYKYFEGYWDVKNINGKWRLWEPKIKEVVEPNFLWFYE